MKDVIIKSYTVAGDLADGFDFEHNFRDLETAKQEYNGIVGHMLFMDSSVSYVALHETTENRTQRTRTETILVSYTKE